MTATTSAKAMTINPAFLQEIKDSNLSLWKALDRLPELSMPAPQRGKNFGELVALLGELRDALALQFALEESYGYMEVPAAIAPVNSHLMQDIRGQHCSLYLAINELAERAEELQYRGAQTEAIESLLGDVREFELRFRDHERMELDLIECSKPTSRRH